MNEMRQAHVNERNVGAYIAPETKVIALYSEGVLCSSVYNNHQGFDFDEVEDL